MIPFIRVLGEGPKYENKTYQYVAEHTIQRVVPVFCVKDDEGTPWICHQGHKGAILTAFQLFDAFDREYSCNDLKELSKLGVLTPYMAPEIGYICDKESDKKIPIDRNTSL